MKDENDIAKMVVQKNFTARMDLGIANRLISIQPTTCMDFDYTFGLKDIWKITFSHLEDFGNLIAAQASNFEKGGFVMFAIYHCSFFYMGHHMGPI